MSSFDEGTANHSKYRIDPPLHILMRMGSDYRTWCGGGLAEKANTVNRLRCPRCTALLRDGVRRGDYDQEELDTWLSSTSTSRHFGVGRR